MGQHAGHPGSMDRRVDGAECQRIRVLLVAQRKRRDFLVLRRRVGWQPDLLRPGKGSGRDHRIQGGHEDQ